MRSYYIILLAIIFYFPLLVEAQKRPDIKRRNFTDSSGRYFHNISIPAYISEKRTGTNLPPKLYSQFPEIKSDANATYFFKSKGKQIVYFEKEDKTKNPNSEIIVYVDGEAPKSSAILKSTNKTIENNQVFYGEGLQISINSKDDLSGVNATFVSINSEDFQLLNGTISIQEEGDFMLNYFSIDKVGNAEEIKRLKISVDFTAPKTTLEISGPKEGQAISLKTKVYFTREDNLSDIINTYYSLNGGPISLYQGGAVPLQNSTDGSYHIEYYSVDKVFNKEEAQSYDFFLDRSSPIVTTDILGDKFIVNDKIYFSGRTKLKLTAVDNKSGVKDIFYSLDETNYIKYENPFYIPSKTGPISIRYYAFDKLGNQGAGNPNEKFQEYKHIGGIVYVDLTGPTLHYEIIGPKFKAGNVNYVSKKSLVKLSGIDPESGLQRLTFRFDSLVEEMIYEKPFALEGDSAGKVDFYGYDNVNNRNLNSFRYIIDNEAPVITPKFSTPAISTSGNNSVYSSHTIVNANIKDLKSGVGIVFYSINGAAELPLKGPFTGFVPNKLYKIKIRSLDKVGNQSVSELVFKTGK